MLFNARLWPVLLHLMKMIMATKIIIQTTTSVIADTGGGFLVPQISRQRYCFDDGLATSVPVDKQYSNKHMFLGPGPNY